MRDVGAADVQTEVGMFDEILGEFCDSRKYRWNYHKHFHKHKKLDVTPLRSPKKNVMIYSLNSEKI